MKPLSMICFTEKAMKVYENCCNPVCRENGINQTAFDVIMFLFNNPEYNTARDICEIRGIRSGIASVAVENLAQNGYLERKTDASDRRKQRLILTEKAEKVAEAGRIAQRKFFDLLCSGISQEEMQVYERITEKMAANIMMPGFRECETRRNP